MKDDTDGSQATKTAERSYEPGMLRALVQHGDLEREDVGEPALRPVRGWCTFCRDPLVLAPCALYAWHSFNAMWLDEVFPLWCIASPTVGGLGITVGQIGIVIAIASVLLVLFQLFLFHRCVTRFKPTKFFSLTCSAMVPAVMLMPFGHEVLRSGSHGGMFFYIGLVRSISSTLNVCAFASVFMLINNSCLHNERGAVNGFAMTLASFTKALGPIIGSSVLAWSLTEGHKSNWLTGHPFSFWAVAVSWIAVGLVARRCLSYRLNTQRAMSATNTSGARPQLADSKIRMHSNPMQRERKSGATEFAAADVGEEHQLDADEVEIELTTVDQDRSAVAPPHVNKWSRPQLLCAAARVLVKQLGGGDWEATSGPMRSAVMNGNDGGGDLVRELGLSPSATENVASEETVAVVDLMDAETLAQAAVATGAGINKRSLIMNVLSSLAEDYPVMVSATSASGAALLRTTDSAFLLKTAAEDEVRRLLRLAPDLQHHLGVAAADDKPQNSLIVVPAAVLRIVCGGDRPGYIMVMPLLGVRSSDGRLAETSYDMKGYEARMPGNAAAQLGSFVERHFLAEHGAEGLPLTVGARDTVRDAVRRDIAWLQKHDLTDYSILCAQVAGHSRWSHFDFEHLSDPSTTFQIGIIDWLKVFDRQARTSHTMSRLAGGTKRTLSVLPSKGYARRFESFMLQRVFPAPEPVT